VETVRKLVEVPREECLRLLEATSVGRLAVVFDDQPLIFPINYALVGSHVVFRTDPGTKLQAAVGRRVAFEIDGVDTLYHEGWSVLVIGTAIEEHDEPRRADLKKLAVGPWGPGPKDHWIRIQTAAITGRRITHSA
jgi:hypothetical protein